MTNKPNCLTKALRQYQHNDGSGFVFGYDIETVDRIIAADKARIAELEARIARQEEVLNLIRAQRDDYAMHKHAAHQLIGIPASVGVAEPVEGFAERPQDIMPAVRDMALRIELLEHQAAERERLLAESRANDRQAMAYLSEVRAIVGGDDFPDMVRRCARLQADHETERAADKARIAELVKALRRFIDADSQPSGLSGKYGNALTQAVDKLKQEHDQRIAFAVAAIAKSGSVENES